MLSRDCSSSSLPILNIFPRGATIMPRKYSFSACYTVWMSTCAIEKHVRTILYTIPLESINDMRYIYIYICIDE